MGRKKKGNRAVAEALFPVFWPPYGRPCPTLSRSPRHRGVRLGFLPRDKVASQSQTRPAVKTGHEAPVGPRASPPARCHNGRKHTGGRGGSRSPSHKGTATPRGLVPRWRPAVGADETSFRPGGTRTMRPATKAFVPPGSRRAAIPRTTLFRGTPSPRPRRGAGGEPPFAASRRPLHGVGTRRLAAPGPIPASERARRLERRRGRKQHARTLGLVMLSPHRIIWKHSAQRITPSGECPRGPRNLSVRARNPKPPEKYQRGSSRQSGGATQGGDHSETD